MNQKTSWKELDEMLLKAKKAFLEVSLHSDQTKKKTLLAFAQALEKSSAEIIQENQKDVENAQKNGLSSAMVDRLLLNQERVLKMAKGVREVAALKDPVGKVLGKWKRPNGLRISKITVPIGVVFMIYESRPNVTVECAALCFKSGNVAILRGGSESFYSNQVLIRIFQSTLKRLKLSSHSVVLVATRDREAVDYLLQKENDIHLVIPRGGKSLIEKVVSLSRIPVIKHYQGICHVYIDKEADFKKAFRIVDNAKMQRTGVCNAMETLLVHQKAAKSFLPEMGQRLIAKGCEIRAERKALSYIHGAKLATEEDFGYEFLDKILAVKIVGDTKEAIEHIQKHGSAHTDAIVTENKKTAEEFVRKVDSSSVMVNASTRFADGFEYGFGAEIGISTDKIHARGPMGLEGLVSYKYVVQGSGQVRT